jgi:hypothetical protein
MWPEVIMRHAIKMFLTIHKKTPDHALGPGKNKVGDGLHF